MRLRGFFGQVDVVLLTLQWNLDQLRRAPRRRRLRPCIRTKLVFLQPGLYTFGGCRSEPSVPGRPLARPRAGRTTICLRGGCAGPRPEQKTRGAVWRLPNSSQPNALRHGCRADLCGAVQCSLTVGLDCFYRAPVPLG